ncbi:MAG: TetR family transcriptional regulator, partial [Methanosphaera sp. rholeuAM130]
FYKNEILIKPLLFWNNFFTILRENGIIRKELNPELLAKEYYSYPIYLLLEICAEYDDIPKDSLENFFNETEEHAQFLLDCIKVK